MNNRFSIDSINDLKQTELPSIVEGWQEPVAEYNWHKRAYEFIDYTKYNDEGKMRHAGYWKERLTAWIKNKMGICLGDFLKN